MTALDYLNGNKEIDLNKYRGPKLLPLCARQAVKALEAKERAENPTPATLERASPQG